MHARQGQEPFLSYEGKLRYGKPHGQGTYKWENGSEYRGTFKDGQRDTTESGQKAKMVWANAGGQSKTFEGQFVNGQCTEGQLDGNPVNVN